MIIIKNRVNGEYDDRGLYAPMDKFNRGAWSRLMAAKMHVSQKITCYSNKLQYVDWYIDADYIEVDENGTHNVYPVVEHLKKYFTDNWKARYLTDEQKRKIGLNE